MRMVEGLMLSGLAIGTVGLGMEGAANLFDYGANRTTLITRAGFDGAAEQSRELRDITVGLALVETAGAGALALTQRNRQPAITSLEPQHKPS